MYKHCRRSISTVKTPPEDRRNLKIGKEQKLDEGDKRIIKQTIWNLHATVGSFTSTRGQLEAGMQYVLNLTVRRYMNELGYHHCRSRKKGLITETDKKLRIVFVGRFTDTNLGSNSGGKASVFILMIQVSFTRKIHLIKHLLQELEGR